MEVEPLEFLSTFNDLFFPDPESYTLSNEVGQCSSSSSTKEYSSCSYHHSQNSFQSQSQSHINSISIQQKGIFLQATPENFETFDDFHQMEISESSELLLLLFNPDDQTEKTQVTKCPEDQNPLFSKETESSYFKGIQEELMEEDSLTDLLLAAAEAIESQNQPIAEDLIQKLKISLFNTGSDSLFNRLACFFTQALHYKNSVNEISVEVGNFQENNDNNITMSAFQILQELTPYIKFAHFTANQSILEAAEAGKTLHIIDFDIMEGIQWPPLMADLASRKNDGVCLLKLTAIVHDSKEARKVQKTGKRLSVFAESINFPFEFDQILIENEEQFEKIEVGQRDNSHTLVGNCSRILQSHGRRLKKMKTFLNGVTKLSPKCIVMVEEEVEKLYKSETMSFVEFFFEAFHHFSAVSESIEKCLFSGGYGYENGFREIEELVGTRILDSVSQFGSESENLIDWLKGYKKSEFSCLNYSQGKCLVSLFRGDFWVKRDKCRLSLCWKSRPLCSATIWVQTDELIQ